MPYAGLGLSNRGKRTYRGKGARNVAPAFTLGHGSTRCESVADRRERPEKRWCTVYVRREGFGEFGER